MTILNYARSDLERDKFVTDSSQQVAVNVKVADMPPIELTVSDIQIGAVEIKDATGSNRVSVNSSGALSVADTSSIAQLQTINSLTPSVYDYIGLSYSGSNLSQVIYKNGGSGGATVSTLSLGYDTASNLISVLKS
jgi:hypothetical protein